MKIYLHLRTACGCTQMIETGYLYPPFEYVIALPSRMSFQHELFPSYVKDAVAVRKFRLTHQIGMSVGQHDKIYSYEEVRE